MLKDIVLETETIRYKGKEFQVNGVSVEGIAQLLQAGERKELEEAFDTVRGLFENKQTDESVEAGVKAVVLKLPFLAAKLIAIAAGEPDEFSKVRKLPVSVQLNAIMAIGRLTFDGEDSIKNFVSGLAELMISTRKAAASLNGTMTATLAARQANSTAGMPA